MALFALENTTGFADGSVASIRNNLIYSVSSSSDIHIVREDGTPTITDGAFDVADYNVYYNYSGSDLYEPVDAKFDSSPGTNDFSQDPEFVNSSRDWLAWGQSVDAGVSDWDDIWAEIRKMNDDSGYDSDFDWSNAYTWIRAGFVPQNAALDGAGYDGSDIGAMDYAPADSGSPAAIMMCF